MAQDVFEGASFAAGTWGSGGHDGVGFYTGGSLGTGSAILSGTAAAFGDLIEVQCGGQTFSLTAYAEVAGGIVLTTPDYASFYVFTSAGFDPSQSYPLSYGFGSFNPPCFVAGTRIATDRGEVAVERLRIGDRVVALRGLRFAEIVWLGHRQVACDGLRGGQDVWPVRIAAHAFAPDEPRRELWLSPDHAVYRDGGLIPVRYLLNGATLTQEPVSEVAYWHVELAGHEVLLAEGLAAESYLDTGNRGMFEAHGRQQAGSPQTALHAWRQRACAPLWVAPEAHEAVRHSLLARAVALGHAATDDPSLRLLVGTTPLPSGRDGFRWRAELPPGADGFRIASLATVPAQMLPDSRDHRRLGVAIVTLTLNGRSLLPAWRGDGWHAPEHGLQWTDGDAMVRCAASPVPRAIELTAVPLLRYWRPRPADRLRTSLLEVQVELGASSSVC